VSQILDGWENRIDSMDGKGRADQESTSRTKLLKARHSGSGKESVVPARDTSAAPRPQKSGFPAVGI
jgi:hypothetical protein